MPARENEQHPSIFFFLQIFFLFVSCERTFVTCSTETFIPLKTVFFHSFCFSFSISFFFFLPRPPPIFKLQTNLHLLLASFHQLSPPQSRDSNRQEPTLAHSTASRLFGLPDLTGVVPPSSQYFQLMEAAPVAPIVQLNSPVMARDGRRFVPGDPSPTRH